MGTRPKRIYGVYTITCKVNGRQYVGSAASVRNRWGTHRWALRHGQHPNKALQADWDEHGEPAFEFRTVAEARDPDLRRLIEQAYLDLVFASGLTYNRAPNSRSNLGIAWTEEQRLTLSMSLTGRKFSAEHRLALSEAAKRRYVPDKGTPEMQERMAEIGRANLGKPKSADHRANIAKGKARLNDEQVAEIRTRFAAGESRVALAAAFGVHKDTIYNVVKYRHHYAA